MLIFFIFLAEAFCLQKAVQPSPLRDYVGANLGMIMHVLVSVYVGVDCGCLAWMTKASGRF